MTRSQPQKRRPKKKTPAPPPAIEPKLDAGDIGDEFGVSYSAPGSFPVRRSQQFSYQRPSEAAITLPYVSIQFRDDFTGADVRAGMADRAWTERQP